MEAVETLAEIMQNKKAPPSARVTAASTLLDRGWGKAPQSLDLQHELSFSAVFEQIIQDIN